MNVSPPRSRKSGTAATANPTTIEKMGEKGETADYLFVDIDCKDLKGVASFPPRPFLEVKLVAGNER